MFRLICIKQCLRLRPNQLKLIKICSSKKKNCRYYSSNYYEDQTQNIIVENIEGIRLIGINRPEKRNCINSSTAEALLKAFKDYDEDEKSKVAVLYGAGGNFCAGYDFEELAHSSLENISELKKLNRGPMGPTRYETSKPVIAAIDGYAVAGGLELALWCDVRIMDEKAILGVFCRRFGVPLIDGGTVRLPAVVGLGRAMDLILTGRPIRASEAKEIGLVSQIAACGSVLGRAVFYAQSLERYPVEALRADRRSARLSAFSLSYEEALQKECDAGMTDNILKEAKKGASRFLEGVGKHGSFESIPYVPPSFFVPEGTETKT